MIQKHFVRFKKLTKKKSKNILYIRIRKFLFNHFFLMIFFILGKTQTAYVQKIKMHSENIFNCDLLCKFVTFFKRVT